MSRGLSVEEQQEMDTLLSSLSVIVRSMNLDDMHLTYLRSVYDAGNLDCLRCFQYVLLKPEPRLFFIIEKCQQAIASNMNREASTFLTPEMLTGALRIDYALRGAGTLANENELFVLLFMNMHRLWDIFALVEDHGITDPAIIQFVLATHALTRTELWQRSLLPETIAIVNNVDQ